jgi:hypothetical protein
MRIRFKTETGSLYEVDDDKKTWSRLTTTEESGPVRTKTGRFLDRTPILLGQSTTFVCPPFVEGTDGRIIQTSRVVGLELVDSLVESEPTTL